MSGVLSGCFLLGACGDAGTSTEIDLGMRDADSDLGQSRECPSPRVFCDAPPPDCSAGTFPEAEPCGGGNCPRRCWTGRCLPCITECDRDADCVLVGRFGCCPVGGGDLCRWGTPRSYIEKDPCAFEGGEPMPNDPPKGCPAECLGDPVCGECAHCSPDSVRCEGGQCVGVFSYCEPSCACF